VFLLLISDVSKRTLVFGAQVRRAL